MWGESCYIWAIVYKFTDTWKEKNRIVPELGSLKNSLWSNAHNTWINKLILKQNIPNYFHSRTTYKDSDTVKETESEFNCVLITIIKGALQGANGWHFAISWNVGILIPTYLKADEPGTTCFSSKQNLVKEAEEFPTPKNVSKGDCVSRNVSFFNADPKRINSNMWPF